MKRRINHTNALSSAALAVLLLSAGCGRRQSRHSDSDSIKAEAKADVEPTRLPDTVYASVEALKYNVEELAPATDGRLESLRDLYSNGENILTFRGGPSRDARYSGKLDKAPTQINVAWRFRTGEDKKWGGGSGWTGQPLYVEWSEATARQFRTSGVVNADFDGREVIVGSLDGHVYFINPDTGKATRESIDTGNPIKGTVSLDPTLNGYLYVGQGIPNTDPFGAYTIDLTNNRIISRFGRDAKARRGWGAYDSSAIRVGQFVFRPGENGSIYKWMPGKEGMTLHSVLRYTRGGAAPGVESSMAVWRNYGYFGDNAGNIVCINLDTMRPVWHYDNHDDTDASIVLAEENGRTYLYTGCEVDKQGEGFGYLVKLDVTDGSKIWELNIPGRLVEEDKKHFDGGFYATPLLGRGDCSGLLFANVVTNNPAGAGKMIAVNRKTGETVWETKLRHYAWSSPVAVMAPGNRMYIFNGDTLGYAYIIKGKTGEIVATERVGNNFESSPIIIGNSVWVGSRGDTIFKLTIN